MNHLMYFMNIWSLITSLGVGAEYIRSDEITLEDNLETNAQIINLNRLMENERLGTVNLTPPNKQQQQQQRHYAFKLVNDTSLVNYIDLRYLNDEASTAVIILKKRLDFDEICEESSALRLSTTCQQTLKIIAVNENNFIEIPIEIKKVLRPARKVRAKLAFDRERLYLKPSALATSHLIDYPRIQLVQNALQRDYDELVSALDFSLSEIMQHQHQHEQYQVVNVRLEKKLTGVRKLKIAVQFANENELLKAYELKSQFKFRLVVFLTPNMTRRFELINETSHEMSMELVVSVDDLNVLNLKPLDFEYPIYSVSIENSEQNPLEVNDTILEPKLKSKSERNNSIVFSLFMNEHTIDNNNNNNNNMSKLDEEFPFFVEQTTGVIRLRKSIVWENESSNEKIFNFGIKASYLNLLERESKSSSYYSYMLPAYSKIQISLLSPNLKDLATPRQQPVAVRSEILSPFVSKYEILNEDSNNQTLILFINDPFSINSRLIKLNVQKLFNPGASAAAAAAAANGHRRRLKSFHQQNNTMYWQLDNYEAFFYDDKSANLTLFNRVDFRDQSVYRTCARLYERVNSDNRIDRLLAEVNIQFRVDFDPLLFEKTEYTVHVTPSTLVGRNLVRIKLKSRLKSIINNNKHDNVTYRLGIKNRSNDPDRFPFEIGLFDGWLKARKELGDLVATSTRNQAVFDIEIIAVNLDLQKSASVKCKIIASCDTNNHKELWKPEVAADLPTIRYSLFNNSPRHTQIGIFKSVCSDPKTFTYDLGASGQLKVCSIDSKCRLVDLPATFNMTNLFTLDPTDGYLMTNSQVNSEHLFSLVNMLPDATELDEIVHLSILVSGSISNLQLTYPLEIVIQSIPRLENFVERLFLIDQQTVNSSQDTSGDADDRRCVYTYQFGSSAGVESIVSRFVRVDKLSMTHLEPDFRLESTSSCSSSFYVYNNGCVAIKWTTTTTTTTTTTSSAEEKSCQMLKAGDYKMEFKLCFYDANKVSCSQLYNQTIIVNQDLSLTASARIRALPISIIDSKNAPSRLEFNDEAGSKAGANISWFLNSKRNGLSVYLLALLVVICMIAVVALVSFLFLFLRPRGGYMEKKMSNKSGSGSSQTSEDKIMVLSGRNFKNMEISTHSSPSSTGSSSSSDNRSNSDCSTTPQTNLDPIVNKVDDENDDMVHNIQVKDDYLTKPTGSSTNVHQIYQQNSAHPHHHHLHANPIKYVYSGPNSFNYAGSFSSIGSSSFDSGASHGINAINILDSQQGGLYSVKTASIHFNQSLKAPLQKNICGKQGFFDTSHDRTNPVLLKQQALPYQLQQQQQQQQHQQPDLIVQNSQPFQSSHYLQQQHQQQQQQQTTCNKNSSSSSSSLKKLKKDLAIRKQQQQQQHQQLLLQSSSLHNSNAHLVSSTTQNVVDSSFASSSSLLPTDDGGGISHNVYDYITRKEVVLSPADVIASVV